MSRYFNNKEVELLAPAGTFDIFNDIIHSNCDAVYLGGQQLNMRMIRKGYNLSNNEIKKAIKIAHNLNKKIYITVNNLINPNEIEVAKKYLTFLSKAKPDAIIAQDFAIIKLIEELGLNLDVHSSVMMNVHNIQMIKSLEELGVSRVVLSREMDLDSVKQVSLQTNMELEYFTHGDMCITHGSQCLYSSVLFGMSSNRGRCLKPCRWPYKIKYKNNLYDSSFPLAVKDMCMYQYIPELIQAGITSFKIEGRMRQKEFIVPLINQYGDAIDRYIKNPINYDRDKNYDYIFNNRKRDLSTAYAFGKPGLSNINNRYEGTGKIYSTGKMFSTPTEEKEVSKERIDFIKSKLANRITTQTNPIKKTLSVKVNNLDQAEMAVSLNVDNIYINGDTFLPDKPFDIIDLQKLLKNKNNSKVFISMPKMMNDLQFNMYKHVFNKYDLDLDGLLVTNLGVLKEYKDLFTNCVGDYNLNIYNSLAYKKYKELGLNLYTISIESNLDDFINQVTNNMINTEFIIHGLPTIMYLEHDLFENILNIDNEENKLSLITEVSELPVYKDIYNKNHILPNKELCYYKLLPELLKTNITSFRIEGQAYTDKQLEELINIYSQGIHNNDFTNEPMPYFSGYTLGALDF